MKQAALINLPCFVPAPWFHKFPLTRVCKLQQKHGGFCIPKIHLVSRSRVTLCALGELRPEVLARAVPVLATFEQTRFHFGDIGRVLDRAVRGAVALFLFLLFGGFLGHMLQRILCLLCLGYPLLGPWFEACRRNARIRSFPYARFLKGRVVGIESTEEGGEIRLKVEGEAGRRLVKLGFTVMRHRRVRDTLGEPVEFIVFSKDSSFERITAHTDMLAPRLKLFIGRYPYLKRTYFAKIRDLA